MWMILGRYLWIGTVVPGWAWSTARIGYGFWKAVSFYERDLLGKAGLWAAPLEKKAFG